MKLEMVKNVITTTAGRSGLILKKYSPEILMFIGITGGIGSTFLACKATLKVDEILTESSDTVEKIHRVHEERGEAVYSEKDVKKDLLTVRVQTAGKVVKLYGPAVTLGLVSIACMLGAHNIMRKRNVALIAAYKAVEKGFSDYRKRVVEELGEEKDRQFRYGITKEKITKIVTDEEGKTTAVDTMVNVVDPSGLSIYAKIFDSTNTHWCNTPEYNRLFLKNQQNIANDILYAKGHIFLNEVYDMLGFEHTSAGSLTGWIKGMGDEQVDFGLFDTHVAKYMSDYDNETIGEKRCDFINGHGNSVILDFNVAGVIYDKI